MDGSQYTYGIITKANITKKGIELTVEGLDNSNWTSSNLVIPSSRIDLRKHDAILYSADNEGKVNDLFVRTYLDDNGIGAD